MDELVRSIGNDDGLRFTLWWDAGLDAAGTAAELTRGSVRLSVRGHVVWHGEELEDGFHWTWVELLEFLAHSWPHLLWEDGLPFALRPTRPAEITARAQARWDDMPVALREPEEQIFESYEETHNLARALQGAWLAPVWVVREGEDCWLCTDAIVVRRCFAEVITTLEGIGAAIAEQLDAAPDEPRASMALKAWANRTVLPVREAVAIATGLPSKVLDHVEQQRPTEKAWGLRADEFEDNELVAAARMAAELPPADVRTLVEEIRSVPHTSTPALDRMEAGARELLSSTAEAQPFEQAYEIARWLRRQLAIPEARRAEPRELLADWGVIVRSVSLESRDVDAFACWGPRHGPAVFLNEHGRHNESVGGRRASLAHELAHLLMDRRGALPLAEVLGGRAAPLAEQRARAFAAEFLLPREEAGAVLAAASDPHRAVVGLQRRYLVSQELAAWQARNSARSLPADVEAFLRSTVSQPHRY